MESVQKPADNTAKILTGVLIAALCVGASALILLILSGSGSSIDQTSAETIGLTITFAFCSLTAAAGTGLVLRKPRLAPVGYLTVAVSVAAFLLTAGVVTTVLPGEWWPLYVLLAAFGSAHSSVLLAAGRPWHGLSFRLVQAGALITTWVMIALAVVDIAAFPDDPPVGIEPLAVVGVLFALGTVVTLLLGRVWRPDDGAASALT
jgi:hypothetical protein